jgi:hypothetical protein
VLAEPACRTPQGGDRQALSQRKARVGHVNYDKTVAFGMVCLHSGRTRGKLPFYLKLTFTLEPVKCL